MSFGDQYSDDSRTLYNNFIRPAGQISSGAPASTAATAATSRGFTHGYQPSLGHHSSASSASQGSFSLHHAPPNQAGYYTSPSLQRSQQQQQQQHYYPPLPTNGQRQSLPPLPTTPHSDRRQQQVHHQQSTSAGGDDIPLVTSDYGYGGDTFSGHYPTTYSQRTPASDYLQVMDQSTEARSTASSAASGTTMAKRPRFEAPRGNASVGRWPTHSHAGGSSSRNPSNLMHLAGYSEFSPPVFATRGRGFQHPYPPRGARERGRGGPTRGGRTVGGAGGAVLSATSAKAMQEKCLANLGKYVMPKSASLTLLDLVGYQSTFTYLVADDDDYEDFKEEKGYYPSILHKCEVKVQDKSYVACSEIKKQAKETCSEKAIPDIMLEKLQDQKRRPKQIGATFDQLEDEVPWTSVCSLALYKLYEDWTAEGFEVPDRLYNFQGVGKIIHNDSTKLGDIAMENLQFKYVHLQQQGLGVEQTDLPHATTSQMARWQSTTNANANPPTSQPSYKDDTLGKVINLSKNPLQLLNEMMPNVSYNVNSFGTRRQFFVTQIELKGVSYTGESYCKKDSKSICAANALKGAFGITFPAFSVPETIN